MRISDWSSDVCSSDLGLQEEDIFAPVLDALRNRAPWLFVNLCTASIASLVASRFEETVSQIVILAFLMSIVAGIGGNSGNQTMPLILRALAGPGDGLQCMDTGQTRTAWNLHGGRLLQCRGRQLPLGPFRPLCPRVSSL